MQDVNIVIHRGAQRRTVSLNGVPTDYHIQPTKKGWVVGYGAYKVGSAGKLGDCRKKILKHLETITH